MHLSYHRCFLAQPATLPQSHQQHLFRFALLHFSPNSSGYCLGGAHILTALQRLHREYCEKSRAPPYWLQHVYCEEIKHDCPVDIREIIGGDHNAVQHSVSKLSMGQVSRIASLRTNPPCRPISNILIWRNEGTLPSCHTRVVILTQSGRLGTAVPMSLISPISHLPVVHFSIS